MSEDEPSDTPRTDAMLRCRYGVAPDYLSLYYICVDDAKQLERELAEALAELARLKQEMKR